VSRAAQCALALRRELPEYCMALSTGFGQLSGRIAMGEAIDRAARLVAGGTDADAPSVSRVDRSSGMLPEDDLSQSGSMPVLVSADVRLDDTTAGLLGAAFDVGGDETGLFLRGTALRETPRTLLGKPTPFVGRERELANLLALFEECRTEPVARAVLVTGPAGAGKSRLRRELLDAIRRADDTANVWIARGDPWGKVRRSACSPMPPGRHAHPRGRGAGRRAPQGRRSRGAPFLGRRRDPHRGVPRRARGHAFRRTRATLPSAPHAAIAS